MKKVLALVLAVIMVCTMAMAINVGGEPKDPNTGATEGSPVNPGTVLAFTADEITTYLAGVDSSIMDNYKDDAGKFVPSFKDAKKVEHKITVAPSYGKGTSLVKSAGWVETDNGWEFQIALKEDRTLELPENYNFSIEKLVINVPGAKKAVTYKFNSDTASEPNAKLLFSVGYEVVESEIDMGKVEIPARDKNPLGGERGFILSVLKGTDKDSKPTNKGVIEDAEFGDLPVTAPSKLYVYTGDPVAFTEKELKNLTDTTEEFNQYNTSVAMALENAFDYADYSVYAKDMDGKITRIPTTLDKGVLTFTVPALSAYVLGEGTIAGATAGTTGNTTNPGTGANDVVGVAAALAVVALVSGAAISLKK